MPLLKRWERPSKPPNRNDKSRQASARLRQIKKATKAQMKRLQQKGRFFIGTLNAAPKVWIQISSARKSRRLCKMLITQWRVSKAKRQSRNTRKQPRNCLRATNKISPNNSYWETVTRESAVMLSTAMRLKVEFICERIAQGAPVEFTDMTWIQKLADRNPTVATALRKARRSAINIDSPKDGLDAFMADLDIGDPDPSNHLVGPQDPTTLAEWFSNRQAWFRGKSNLDWCHDCHPRRKIERMARCLPEIGKATNHETIIRQLCSSLRCTMGISAGNDWYATTGRTRLSLSSTTFRREHKISRNAVDPFGGIAHLGHYGYGGVPTCFGHARPNNGTQRRHPEFHWCNRWRYRQWDSQGRLSICTIDQRICWTAIVDGHQRVLRDMFGHQWNVGWIPGISNRGKFLENSGSIVPVDRLSTKRKLTKKNRVSIVSRLELLVVYIIYK